MPPSHKRSPHPHPPYKTLQFIVVFALILCLSITSPSPSASQTPVPNPHAALTQRIQEQAKRDLSVGRLQRPEDIRKLFADEAKRVGLPLEEIDKTYDEAYAKAKEAQETDPQEVTKVLQNWQGWLAVVVLSAIFAFFKDSVAGAIQKIATAINTWIYQRFSGTRLFWNIALKKYRQALIAKHQELKIPFRPNRPLVMAEIYVPLQIAGSRTSEHIEAKQAVMSSPRLMVTGQPGSGKTMLLKFLALSYGLGQLYLPEEPVVILLELHRLSDTSLTIEQQLVNALARDNFPNGLSFVQQSLQKGTMLLLFDGLDEVNSIDRPQVVKRLKDFLDTHECCRVVLTCRTQVYQGEFDSLVNQTLEVMDFTDRQIRQFLTPWQATMPPEKSVEQLLQVLRERPRILEMARNPLLLTIIAYLYSDTPFVLPHSRAEFYQRSTDILLESWDQSKQTPNLYKGFTKRLVLQQLALFAQDTARQRGADRKTLNWQEVLTQVKTVLPGLNLDESKDAQSILDEVVDRSGLLMRIDGGARYQFTHLTLQEFFAAAQLVDNPQGLMRRFQQDSDAWQEVIKLWCGLANDSTEVIRQVYASQPVMAFECLADAQNVEAQLADAIIEDFKGQLWNCSSANSRIAQAFGVVAADMRPRGKAIFDFLVKTCKTATSSESQIAAIQALSYTNLPKAAQSLIKFYPNSLNIRQGLIQLGDLAIPYLKQHSGQHRSVLVEDLMKIGTPEAARELVPYLWHDDSTIETTAALYLAELLPQPAITEALHAISLTSSQNPTIPWDWIWQPFDPPQNSSLPKIAARIADLLATHSIQQEMNSLIKPDIRLVIPICAFSEELHKHLPKKLPRTTKALLFSTVDSDDPIRHRQLQQAADKLLKSAPQDSNWRKLLLTLSPQIQLDLLSRLITNRQPTHKDWIKLFRPVQYNFQSSGHYCTILLIAVILSIGALVEMVYLLYQAPKAWTAWLLGLPILIVVYAWLFLWQGINTRLESTLFIKFGVLGFIEFWREIKQLIKGEVIWVGIEPFYEIVTSKKAVAFAFAFAFVFAFAIAGTSAFVIAFAIASAVAITGAVAFAVAFAGSFAGAGTGAIAVAIAGAFASTVVGADTVAGAIGGAFVFAIAGAGIGFWYRTKKKNYVGKYFAGLAFPFFCSAPTVLTFATLGLLNFFPWQIVALIWLVLITFSIVLWQRGQYLDQRAGNPLQGILPKSYANQPQQHQRRRHRFLRLGA